MGKADYDVGRGKPPKATRFKTGKSGNPAGRPKKAPAVAAASLFTGLVITTQVTHPDGSTGTILAEEAGEIAILERAFKGDHAAIRLVVNWIIDHELAVQKLAPSDSSPVKVEFINDAPYPDDVLRLLDIAAPADHVSRGLGLRSWAVERARARQRKALKETDEWQVRAATIPDIDPQ